ncbi:c-type cytochrome [Achromobacter xylosoxidans]|uniref:c-type cytochrome n=1 Tax=Alcaligenes xylosoxydans xylosoxydans TaxID=85698 RepID=UPI0022B90DAC|nr:c-type cytochrome [Achromobacter xylosoxidans]MCZ8390026.1 c-type cytochrome [Achromobacter xylosoxidans]
MIEHRNGILIAVALMVGVPAITLVATLHQMFGTGGEGPIRASAVQAPAAAPAASPSPSSAPSTAAPAQAPRAAASPTPPASAAATPAAPAPVPGRSALDFSASRPAWEGYLRGADPEQGKQLAAAGKPAAGVQACVACHGQAGITPSGGIFPNLAGLTAEYIAKQLADFRQGTRKQPLMNTIAQGLSEQEIGQLAAYYGRLAGPPLHVGEAGGEAARKLDQVGDGTRALPACANCHGLRGLGEGPLLPRLAGQSKEYFADQINAFRNGSRQNDDVGVMRAFAQRLTDSEVEALGQYYAGAR